MFLFCSLLAASIDGFVCGFLAGATGVKFSVKEFIKSFIIIFICCIIAALIGIYITYTAIGKYIDMSGVIIMLILAASSLRDTQTDDIILQSSITALALSVAADASVVCMYLAMDGHSILYVSFISALMHSGLMTTAAYISRSIISEKMLVYTKYISRAIFFIMAVYKYFQI